MSTIYHVAKNGSDFNEGSAQKPFLTIQKAADKAEVGDTVIVHEGEYREWVRPRVGGLHDGMRITYKAADGEHVVIKGSERITGWEKVEGTVWKVELSNEIFGDFNPYADELKGDWFLYPVEKRVHSGEVYLNGKSFYESFDLEGVMNPQKRTRAAHWTWDAIGEDIPDVEQTVYQWYTEVNAKTTVIYANFHGTDPNVELVEINVRRYCFYPEVTGINYITVSGFEMAQAATPFTPPTADQPGLLGAHWSKGWIIENNDIHDSKCSGISLGKEASTGDNNYTRWGRKPGYQYQMEAVFRARMIGWSKENIGSHIVRNNKIHDCGQNGIVGHMGGVFSEIYNNEIYNIAVKHEFNGHEIGGIKMHAAIDVIIRNNYIHDTSLGIWLDWEAQGTRVSKNIFSNNNRDLMIEVTHGPCLVDNNILADDFALVNAAQGSAYVNNIIGGFMQQYPVLNRATPYHLPHSTELLGTTLVYGSDDRWYNNIIIGGFRTDIENSDKSYGTTCYNGATLSAEEYKEKVLAQGTGDVEQFENVKQPVYMNANAYLRGSKHFDMESGCYSSDMDPELKIVPESDGVYLEITLPEEVFKLDARIATTDSLGMTRLTEERFENPDGSALSIDSDLIGNSYEENCILGAVQSLKPGKNRVKIWG